VGASETTGVKEISGGARLGGAADKWIGLSAAEVREERLDCEFWIVYEGRLCSLGLPVVLEAVFVEFPDAAATADDIGAAKVFFIREKMEVTMVYEDWSFSSSSENGLKEVKLITSSASLVLLRDLEDRPLKVGSTGEVT